MWKFSMTKLCLQTFVGKKFKATCGGIIWKSQVAWGIGSEQKSSLIAMLYSGARSGELSSLSPIYRTTLLAVNARSTGSYRHLGALKISPDKYS